MRKVREKRRLRKIAERGKLKNGGGGGARGRGFKRSDKMFKKD
jgi:hypothetical protein